MSTPTVYYHEASPPSRSVLMLIKVLDLKCNLKRVDLFKSEQKQPEYLKKFPMHTVPSLEENGFYLWESHAILRYLMNKYAQSDELYPKDPQKRAVVDRLLDADFSFFRKLLPCIAPQVFGGQAENLEKRKELDAALDDINTLFSDQGPFLTGDQYTIADLSLISHLTFADIIKFDYSKWDKISKCISNCHKISSFKEYYAPTEELARKYAINKSIF